MQQSAYRYSSTSYYADLTVKATVDQFAGEGVLIEPLTDAGHYFTEVGWRRVADRFAVAASGSRFSWRFDAIPFFAGVAAGDQPLVRGELKTPERRTCAGYWLPGYREQAGGTHKHRGDLRFYAK